MQKPEDEMLLRKVLFDAVLLVEYPFFYLNAKYIKSLTLTRLIVTHEAVEYFRYEELIKFFYYVSIVLSLYFSMQLLTVSYCRGVGDQTRALSYTRAFSASRIPWQIIKWVTSLSGVEENAGRTNGSSPKSLMRKYILMSKIANVVLYSLQLTYFIVFNLLNRLAAEP